MFLNDALEIEGKGISNVMNQARSKSMNSLSSKPRINSHEAKLL